MSKNLLESVPALEGWVAKQSKPLKWAVAVETGRYEEDAWHPYTGIDTLPKGRKLILRAVDGKGGVHVLLPIIAGTLMPPGEDVRSHALQQRQRELDQREAELNRREGEMLAEQRRAQMENATIARKLDERSSAFVGNLKEVESLGRERAKAEQDMLMAIDAALQRAQSAEANNETAAAITYAADRVLGAIQLWRVKTVEGIPADLLKDFQGYLADRAHRRFLEHLPDGPRKWATDFLRLPQPMRDETLKALNAALKDEQEARKQQSKQA